MDMSEKVSSPLEDDNAPTTDEKIGSGGRTERRFVRRDPSFWVRRVGDRSVHRQLIFWICSTAKMEELYLHLFLFYVTPSTPQNQLTDIQMSCHDLQFTASYVKDCSIRPAIRSIGHWQFWYWADLDLKDIYWH